MLGSRLALNPLALAAAQVVMIGLFTEELFYGPLGFLAHGFENRLFLFWRDRGIYTHGALHIDRRFLEFIDFGGSLSRKFIA